MLARRGGLPIFLGARLVARRHLATIPVPESNIGYVRLVFNAGNAHEQVLRARVFDTPTGHAFLGACPHVLPSLQSYGEEVYGSLRVTLPSSQPQSLIPPGGLAYSSQGQYLCVFFGQAPAWPVDYIAQIEVGYEYLRGSTWRDMYVSKEDPLAMESY